MVFLKNQLGFEEYTLLMYAFQKACNYIIETMIKISTQRVDGSIPQELDPSTFFLLTRSYLLRPMKVMWVNKLSSNFREKEYWQTRV